MSRNLRHDYGVQKIPDITKDSEKCKGPENEYILRVVSAVVLYINWERRHIHSKFQKES